MKIFDYSKAGFWRKLESACAPTETDAKISAGVEGIISDIRKRGDKALFELTEKFDGAHLKKFRVGDEEIRAARAAVPAGKKRAIREAIECVKAYHRHTMPKNWRAKNPHGAVIGENFYPIRRVGIYVPGGSAPLASTVVMTVTLAKLAGCPEICVCTPPSADGSVNAYILCALSMAGAGEIYKAGGAQAIAAMACGTASIRAVDKLYGPGNAYVIEAKRQLFGKVGCDLLPGPSEVMIIADSSANPKYIASDLLSQAEHGSGKEKIYLACTNGELIGAVGAEVKNMSKYLSRADKFLKIIRNSAYAIIVPDLTAAAEVANYIAPEHLELHVKNPDSLALKIGTAGALLLGENTPTVLGDFTAGPSHTLPTGRTGRFSGGLQLSDFMRRSSLVKYGSKSLKKAAGVVGAFSEMEMLDAHGNSLKIRLG